MWQAIAEVVKQGMRNIANSGKNAQENGSTANGGVGLVNPDSKKINGNSEDTTSTAQTTEDTSSVETTKQEEPIETDSGSSGGGVGGGMPNMPMGDKGSPMGNMGGAEGASSMGGGAPVTSDKNAKDSKDVSNDNKDGKDKKDASSKLKAVQQYASNVKDGSKSAQINGSVASFSPITQTVVSDERLKDIFGEETPIDCFAKIHAYEFKYTPEAQEIMQGKNHVDDKEHLGVMAQELLSNPATSACVIKDNDGFLKVDTAQLTMANTATIAELSRKIQKLEEMLGER